MANSLEKEQAGGIMLSDFKLYYKAIMIKAVWSWYTNRYRDQWSTTEGPEISPPIQGQFVCHKGTKNIPWGKYILFSKQCWVCCKMAERRWINELKWTGMGEFNSDDHYIYYGGQESLRRNEVALVVNKRVQNAVLECKLKNDRMICLFPRQTIQYHSNPSLGPNQ